MLLTNILLIVNYFAIVNGRFVTFLLVNCWDTDTLRTRTCHTRRAFLRGRAAADPAGLGRGAQLVKVAKVKVEVEGGAKAARKPRKAADQVLPRTLNHALNTPSDAARHAVLRAVDAPRQARVN